MNAAAGGVVVVVVVVVVADDDDDDGDDDAVVVAVAVAGLVTCRWFFCDWLFRGRRCASTCASRHRAQALYRGRRHVIECCGRIAPVCHESWGWRLRCFHISYSTIAMQKAAQLVVHTECTRYPPPSPALVRPCSWTSCGNCNPAHATHRTRP